MSYDKLSEAVYKPGDYVKFMFNKKEKAIIPDRASILEFWKDLRASDNCPPIYKTMTDDQFVEAKLKVYANEKCMCSRTTLDYPENHHAYVVYFVDPITNALTGKQDTHICERQLRLWK